MDGGEVWRQVIGTQPDPPAAVVLGAAVVALALVAWRPAWRVSRGVVTIAHEGGHAAAAALTGRRLLGVRLHSDTSGLTVSAGRATGPGMVLTLAAGYLTPSLLGLAGAALLAAGRITALLWVALALLAALLPLIRNTYGVVSVLATGAVVFGLSWYGSAAAQAAFGYLLTWFLLLSGPRPVLELPAIRRPGRGSDSDPDQLARLTGLGAPAWVVLFGALTLGAAAFGLLRLMPWEGLAT